MSSVTKKEAFRSLWNWSKEREKSSFQHLSCACRRVSPTLIGTFLTVTDTTFSASDMFLESAENLHTLIERNSLVFLVLLETCDKLFVTSTKESSLQELWFNAGWYMDPKLNCHLDFFNSTLACCLSTILFARHLHLELTFKLCVPQSSMAVDLPPLPRVCVPWLANQSLSDHWCEAEIGNLSALAWSC